MNKVSFKFEELKVYQKSIDFLNEAYLICVSFPKEENYRLTSQFIRAANSIALNIAEGAGIQTCNFCAFYK